MPIHTDRNNSTIIHTPEGGLAMRLINKTGAPSVKGTLVDADTTTDFAVRVVPADSKDCMGVIYEDGVPDGERVLVVTSGPADVLLEDGTAATTGYWARVSPTAPGRADITTALPPGGTITEIDNHFKEIGHCLQSVVSGINKLARVFIHFN